MGTQVGTVIGTGLGTMVDTQVATDLGKTVGTGVWFPVDVTIGPAVGTNLCLDGGTAFDISLGTTDLGTTIRTELDRAVDIASANTMDTEFVPASDTEAGKLCDAAIEASSVHGAEDIIDADIGSGTTIGTMHGTEIGTACGHRTGAGAIDTEVGTPMSNNIRVGTA